MTPRSSYVSPRGVLWVREPAGCWHRPETTALIGECRQRCDSDFELIATVTVTEEVAVP